MITKETIQAKILTDDVWLERGVYAIWEFQTQVEKQNETTRHHNNVGFNGVDGKIMTSFGNQIHRKVWGKYAVAFGSCLSEKQKRIARRKMGKYAGQLLKIAKKNDEEKERKRAIYRQLLEIADASRRAAADLN